METARAASPAACLCGAGRRCRARVVSACKRFEGFGQGAAAVLRRRRRCRTYCTATKIGRKITYALCASHARKYGWKEGECTQSVSSCFVNTRNMGGLGGRASFKPVPIVQHRFVRSALFEQVRSRKPQPSEQQHLQHQQHHQQQRLAGAQLFCPSLRPALRCPPSLRRPPSLRTFL